MKIITSCIAVTLLLFICFVSYNSFSYEEIFLTPSHIENYRISNIGTLNIFCRGTWNDSTYATPYSFYIRFTSAIKVNSIFVKKFTIVCNKKSYDLAISNKNIKNKQNQYYFSCQYFKKTFNKNDIIEYKITLAVNGYDYHLDIPVPISYKVVKNNKILLFFQQ